MSGNFENFKATQLAFQNADAKAVTRRHATCLPIEAASSRARLDGAGSCVAAAGAPHRPSYWAQCATQNRSSASAQPPQGSTISLGGAASSSSRRPLAAVSSRRRKLSPAQHDFGVLELHYCSVQNRGEHVFFCPQSMQIYREPYPGGLLVLDLAST